MDKSESEKYKQEIASLQQQLNEAKNTILLLRTKNYLRPKTQLPKLHFDKLHRITN